MSILTNAIGHQEFFSMIKFRFKLFFCLTLLFLACVVPSIADEGLWTFNNPPRKQLKEKYGFDADLKWLEHVQKSSVRFNSGGSGSFISASGLTLTNHHVAGDCLQELSTKEKDYFKDGYYARNQSQEVPCLDLELNALINIEDVTERVKNAIKRGLSQEESEKARRTVLNTIEQESFKSTGLRSDVVTLYRGAQYHLYRYKRYTDVRLVFAPEVAIAFFGGDPDNFEFPRYDLDMAIFRIYENNQPVRLQHFLKWSKEGVKEGNLVFVSGNPGATNRLNTVAQLEFMRDRHLPYLMNYLRQLEVLYGAYTARNMENQRRAQAQLYSAQNGRKATLGELNALQDPSVIGKKQKEEKDLKRIAENDPSIGDPWMTIAETQRIYAQIYSNYWLLESRFAFRSKLFDKAIALVRLAAESTKPNAERLREYSESRLDSLKQQLFSEEPIYEDFETLKLADSLSFLAEQKGINDPLVIKVLNQKSPHTRAVELIAGTKLKNADVRKKLFEGGQKAIDSSDDSMILLALIIDPEARKYRKIYDEQVDEPQKQAYEKLAAARLKMSQEGYPDGTFSPRLSFGTVQGYLENGKQVSFMTQIEGAFRRASENENRKPFELPESWMRQKQKINLGTPFNFVSTNDIIGGNSGSPVINTDGEMVGLVFDVNLSGLGWDFVYQDQTARTISVDSRAIIEALRNIYDAGPLLDELEIENGKSISLIIPAR